MKTTVVYKYCLSAEDNSNLNLFVYNLTVGLVKESINGVEYFCC